MAIPYCPLTGSSISFDRAGIGGQELRVSGLLQDNNLVMFDKSDDASLWGQMSALGICGSARGRALPSVQSIETSFAEWRSMHPDTKVASSETGYDRNYSVNPYVDYRRTDPPPLFQTELPDGRLPPKQLVLAIPGGEVGGLAIPFNERAERAINLAVDDAYMVAFWVVLSRHWASVAAPIGPTWRNRSPSSPE